MITWFDALLITLLAIATALGARRGLAGLAWGVASLGAAFVANSLGLGLVPCAVLALILSAVISFGVSRTVARTSPQLWHLVVGGLGGLLLGTLLISTLSLSFPLGVRTTTTGKQALYPSPDLKPELYEAVAHSAIQTGLRSVWTSGRAVRSLLIPDLVK